MQASNRPQHPHGLHFGTAHTHTHTHTHILCSKGHSLLRVAKTEGGECERFNIFEAFVSRFKICLLFQG
jgi:hypothetical protein